MYRYIAPLSGGDCVIVMEGIMKNYNRWLAVLMCLCLLCTSVQGYIPVAFAEAENAAVSDAVQDGTDLIAVPESLPVVAPTDEVQQADDLTEEVLELGGDDQQSAPSAQTDSPGESAADVQASEFNFGYAKVNGDAALYAEFNAQGDILATIKGGEIVLAIERREESGLDWMKVTFVYQNTAETAWMDAAQLTAMSDAEVDAFQDGITSAICYQDDVNYPLPEPAIVLPATDAAEEESQSDESQADEATTDAEVSAGTEEGPELADTPVFDDEQAENPSGDTSETSSSDQIQQPSDMHSSDEMDDGAVMVQTVLYSVDDETEATTMSLSISGSELKVGETAKVEPVFSDGASYSVTYTLSVSGIVEIQNDGTLKAIAPGSVTVTATCQEPAASAGVQVTVVQDEENPAGELSGAAPADSSTKNAVVPELVEMLAGEAKSIACTPPEGAEGSVQYALSAENVVAVSADGMMTAIGAGNCTVTAALVPTAEGVESTVLAVYQVTVYALPESLSAALTDALAVGETAAVAVETELSEYAASKITYTSSSDAVAKVDADGLVTAMAPGDCKITVTLGGLTCSLPVQVYTAPDSFEFSISAAQLNVGDTAQLTVVLPEHTGGRVTYASENAAIAGVDQEGLVMAVGPGKCRLTATIGEVSRSVDVEVYGKPSSLEMTLEESSIPVGYCTQASVELPEYIVAQITYSSSDPKVASVDANGVITALSGGDCEIIASADNGVEARCALQVYVPEIDLSVKYYELAVKQSFTLKYTLNDEELAGESPVFTSSDETKATVDAATGKVTAVSDGEVVITLTIGEASANCYVTVRKAPTRVVVTSATKTIGQKQITNPIGYALYAGDERTIGTVSFATSNKKIVQVNSKGQMLGVATGTATIKITAYNGVSTSFKVTVKKAPSRLTISPTSATLAVGQTGKISYKLTSNTAAGMTFVSSNPGVATVSATGVVTAVGVGSCQIKVATHNGLVKYSKITVKKAPENVTLKLSATKLGVNMTASAVPTVDTSSNVSFAYTYWTDNPEILSVNQTTGAVKALKVGTANVFVKTYNGVTSHSTEDGRSETSVQVMVVPNPDQIAIEGTEFNIIVGKIIKLPVRMMMNDGSTDCLTTYKLTTSNSKIAAVNSAGQIKGMKAGTATIAVTTANGLKKTCKVVVRSSPTKVKLNASSGTLGVGMTYTLKANIYYSSSKYFTYSYEDALGTGKFYSSNSAVATVNQAGLITAVQKGTATITFKTLNGKSASFKLTVKGVPTTIGLDKSALKLGVDMTGTLKSVFKSDELGPVSYSSSDSAIATVDQSGKVTAKAIGTATITVTAGEGITASCAVTVVPKPDQIAIEGTEFNIIVGKIIKLPIKMTMNDGSTDCLTTYKLTTSNSKIAAVNSAGQIKGMKAGTATIAVTTANGLKKTCKVVVRSSPTKVKLNASSGTLGVGMTYTLKANIYYSSSKYFTYSYEDALGVGKFYSSNAAVVKVDANTGKVTAVGVGTASIMFKTLNGKSATCKITVKPAPTSVTLSKSTLKLGVKMTSTLTAAFNSGAYGWKAYSSSDPSVATVDGNGVVKAVGVGKTTITVTTLNDVSDSCEVEVVHAPDKITLNMSSSNLAVKGTITLKASYSYQGTSDCMATIGFKSSNTKVATVTSAGVVKGIKTGSAVIRAYDQAGHYVDCKVTVRKAPTKVVLGKTSYSLGVGQAIKVTGKVYYSGGSIAYSPNDTSYVRLSVADTSIARINAAGELIGIEVGKTKLYMKTYNGKSATCTVYVAPGPEWISMDESFLNLSVGESKALTCQTSAGSVTTIAYTSSDASVAKVSGSGTSCTITAVAPGSATITATSSNGCTFTCEVTIMAKPEAIAFSKSSISIGINEVSKLPKVSVTSSQGECSQAVAYSVSGSAVAMTSPGYVTGVSTGTAVVTASTYNGLTATCTVVVEPEPTKITVQPAASKLNVGDTTTLNVQMDAAGSYEIQVDQPDVIEVSEDGVVTALSVGSATITVVAYNGCKNACTIQVLPSPGWVKFESDAVTLAVGMSRAVAVSVQEDTLGTVAYASENEAIATVDASGNILARAAGSTALRAYVVGNEEVFDTCEVTVLAQPTSIALSASALTLRQGTSTKLTATLTNEKGDECFGSPVFASSNSNVATVAPDGTIQAVGAGEAVIEVSADGDSSVTASCSIVVVNAKVGLDVEQVALAVGETYALRIDLPDGKDNFSIESDNASVANVTEEGVIVAIAQGEATITATNGGDTAACVVKVTQAPTGIALSAVQKRLVIGKSFALAAAPQPEGTACRLTYSSSNSAVAAVNEDGVVEAVGYGTAVIRASSLFSPSLYAECTVTVVYEPETIRFAEMDDIAIAVGDHYTLEAPKMFHPDGDCDTTYMLAISNPGCARIAVENGRFVLYALSEGTASLRLKTANGLTASKTVVVLGAPASIGFEEQSIRMAVGEDYVPNVVGDNGAKITAALTSSNEQVVSVSEDGSLHALAIGTATVTATSKLFPDLKAEVAVRVLSVPTSMALSNDSLMLAVGETTALEPIFEEGTAAANVDYVSSDETVVQVGRNGLVRAVGIGKATIRATSMEGCTAQCEVTVMAAPTAIRVQPSEIVACVKDEVQLEVAFGGENEYANLTYESTNPDVAQVSKDGLVTFAAIGEAVICVETINGLSAEVPVTVCETPTGVSFDPESAVILVGDQAQLKIVFQNGMSYYTLESSNPEAVSVSADGTVQALKPGKATIELKTSGSNLAASCEITAVEALDGISLTAEKSTLELNETTQLSYSLEPANAIGTGLVTFKTSDPAVATVDAETGLVTGIAYGTAQITVTTGDGKTDAIDINVLGGKRRMLVAYYFGETGDVGYLPFAYNNGQSMVQAFSASVVEGQKYDIAGPMSNASKSTLLGTIDSHFADATDEDVSVIYICAHGSGAYGPTGEYAFALDSTHYVTASELMNRLERIKGHVILIMDSCHSGGMIDCNSSRLSAAGGRISILASSHRSTTSCYWSVSQKLTSIDFYTHAVLQGVGFNEANGIGGSRGWFRTSGGPADDAGNGDGMITVQELFNYAQKVTVANVTKYKGYSQFRGNPAQVPQSYIGSANQNIVLFGR